MDSITDKQKSYILGLYKELNKTPESINHLTKAQARALIQMFLEEKEDIDNAKLKSYKLDKQMKDIQREIDILYEPIRKLQAEYNTLKEEKLSLCKHYRYTTHKAERNVGSWTTVRIEHYYYAKCLDCGYKWDIDDDDLLTYIVSVYTGDDIEIIPIKKNLINNDCIHAFIQKCYGKDAIYKKIVTEEKVPRTLQL